MANIALTRMRGVQGTVPLVSAIVGFGFWLALVFLPIVRLGNIERLFLLGPLTIVPLGLSLARSPNRQGRDSLLYMLSVWLQPPAAAMVALSFQLSIGLAAMALTLPWLGVTGLVCLFGLARLLPRSSQRAEEICLDAGLMYLVVGGAWLLAARLNNVAFGFPDPIPLLTAVHFHFAGFAAPVIVAAVGRLLRNGSVRTNRLYAAVVICTVAGIPLVAAGISLTPWLELIGAVVLAIGLVSVAIFMLIVLLRNQVPALARILGLVASGSVFAGMSLALLWAGGRVQGTTPVALTTMVQYHGFLQAIEFSLSGLICMALLAPAAAGPLPGIPFSRLRSRGHVGPDYFTRSGSVAQERRPPHGLVDSLDAFTCADFDADRVHPDVRRFYEQTHQYTLAVYPRWQNGFQRGGRLWRALARRIGQLNLPVVGCATGTTMQSQLVPISDVADGRQNVRGWIRTYESSGAAVYVAAYSHHADARQVYMNIAFPLPGGNLTSILRLGHFPDDSRGGVSLTSWARPVEPGDEGVYYWNRLLPVRLPMNETITVWPAPAEPEALQPRTGTIQARHEMWLFGYLFLVLDYVISPVGDDAWEMAD